MCRSPFQTPEVSPAVQQSTNEPIRGRHRATALHSHRSPSSLTGQRSAIGQRAAIGPRGRYALLTVALLAGIGVAGFSAATAGAHPASHTPTAMDVQAHAQTPVSAQQTPLTPTSAATSSPEPSISAATPTGTPEPSTAPLGYARAQQKERPVVVVEAKWVHPMPGAAVTSCFGQRWGRLHAGVDLASPSGTPIRAAGAGTVVLAGVEGGYGNAVLVDHGNGYLTHYGHMSAIVVKVGQKVATGEQIGNEGSTGHSTGPHLHFEVHKGTYKNPIEPTAWMHEHGVDIAGCVPLTAAKKE
jgi:murein DD-endopeptidase MepM/ murein hydrolase activator NlpD